MNTDTTPTVPVEPVTPLVADDAPAAEPDATTEPDVPSPLLVRLAHGGEVIFHGTKARLAKRYPGAAIIRYADGKPYRGEKQV